MKILYLRGWNSVVRGVKPTYRKSHGHEVIEPALDQDDFQRALETARQAFDQHQSNIMVGRPTFQPAVRPPTQSPT
jgi:hypothetical protein